VGRPTANVVEPQERLEQLRAKKRTKDESTRSGGWTLKGVPPDVVSLTRRAAQRRGMRIGSWVAECLNQAAARDLDDPAAVVEVRPDEVLRKLDNIAESIKSELRAISEHNRDLDQELAVIRRGLLPRIMGG
jgi:hypothetical protein